MGNDGKIILNGLEQLMTSLATSTELKERFINNRSDVAREFGLPDEYLQAMENISSLKDSSIETSDIKDGLKSSAPKITTSIIYKNMYVTDIPIGCLVKLNHAAANFIVNSDEVDTVNFVAGFMGDLGVVFGAGMWLERKAIKYQDKGKGVHFNFDMFTWLSITSGMPCSDIVPHSN